MLTEQWIASIATPLKAPGTHIAKDAAIFIHEYQPLAAQKQLFKKSATNPNCLAVSETHIFAAQIDKAVVHVYNREKGSQEATVPFPERISALTLACNDTVLILGTTDGRIFAWETASGRLVSTAQAHLQAITALVVDVKSNFLISSSKDSTIHVWSILDLLAFTSTQPPSPRRTFSSHSTEVVALAIGHSASSCNFVVSASNDKTCLVWDYRTNGILRTYLLPGIPTCITLDPADRAFYIGYEDGSVQQIDLFSSPSKSVDSVHNARGASTPIQPPASSRWKIPDASHGSALSMALSFDGTTLLTGHVSGAILSWDVNKGTYLTTIPHTPLPGPVSNLSFLPVTGFDSTQPKRESALRIAEVTKPKFGVFSTSEDGQIPGNYALTVSFPTDLRTSRSAFESALYAPTVPSSMIEDGLADLAAFGQSGAAVAPTNGTAEDNDADFMAFDDESGAGTQKMSLQQENEHLKRQVEALQRVQMKSLQRMKILSEENAALERREQRRRRDVVGEESDEADEEMEDGP